MAIALQILKFTAVACFASTARCSSFFRCRTLPFHRIARFPLGKAGISHHPDVMLHFRSLIRRQIHCH